RVRVGDQLVAPEEVDAVVAVAHGAPSAFTKLAWRRWNRQVPVPSPLSLRWRTSWYRPTSWTDQPPSPSSRNTTSLSAVASWSDHPVTWVLTTRWRWGRRGVHFP